MILRLLTFPVDSFIWIAEQVQERVIAELEDQENLSKKLTKLQIQLDMGEIEEEEYMIQEQELLERMEAAIASEEHDKITTLAEEPNQDLYTLNTSVYQQGASETSTGGDDSVIDADFTESK